MDSNTAVLERIATFLEPCPVLYTRLAMVNKSFYCFFTSDKLWEPFNVYDLDNGIFDHFIKTTKGHEGLTRLHSCYEWHCPSEISPEDNSDTRYILQFHLLKSPLEHSTLYDWSFSKRLLDRDPSSFAKFHPVAYSDYYICLYACQKSAGNLMYVSPDLTSIYTFLQECLYAHAGCAKDAALVIALAHPQFTLSLYGFLYEVAPAVAVAALLDVSEQAPFNPVKFGIFTNNILPTIDTTVVAQRAFKGIGQYLHFVPHFTTNRLVAVTAINRYTVPRVGYPFLQTNINPQFWEAILKVHPQLLFMAPHLYRGIKNRVRRFLAALSYCNIFSNISRYKLITNCFPVAIWSDRNLAGYFIDTVRGSEADWPDYINVHLPAPLQRHFDDPSWVARRIESWPGAWALASDRLKRDRSLVLCAIENIRVVRSKELVFGKSKDSVFGTLPEFFHKDKHLLKQLFEVLRPEKLVYYTQETIMTREIAWALVDADPLMMVRFRYPRVFSQELAFARELILEKYARNPDNIAHARSIMHRAPQIWCYPGFERFTPRLCPQSPLRCDWNDPESVARALEFRGTRTCDFAELISINVAIEVVKLNGYLFTCLPPSLQSHPQVQGAVGRPRGMEQYLHKACRPRDLPR